MGDFQRRPEQLGRPLEDDQSRREQPHPLEVKSVVPRDNGGALAGEELERALDRGLIQPRSRQLTQ